MTLVLDDPSFWPLINIFRISSYFGVASCMIVVYDWALTFGQEFDLIWRKRWSLMTVLYLAVRYIGLAYSSVSMWFILPVPVTDVGCSILFLIICWMSTVANTMLCIIMIVRLHVMYQQSRKMFIFLTSVFFPLVFVSGAVTVIIESSRLSSGPEEELVLPGMHQCIVVGNDILLPAMSWIFGTVWEVLALCLATWVAIKHFRELPTGWAFGDCFTALIQSHVLYFASFAAVACFNLVMLSPIFDANTVGDAVYVGISQILSVVQIFVLGPRLILSIRQYNAKVVANPDEVTSMVAIAFQERIRTSTSNDV